MDMGHFGIGRIPADVNPADEAIAEIEADELVTRLVADGATAREQRLLRTWRCTGRVNADTGEPVISYAVEDQPEHVADCADAPNLTIWRSGTEGSRVYCERHWLAYHSHRGSSVDAVLASFRQSEEQAALAEYSCARCGTILSGLEWNAGAGAYLCDRHWDAY
jgi:hypothetical protein